MTLRGFVIWNIKGIGTYEKRGGLNLVSFDWSRFKLFTLKFSKNLCRPYAAGALKLLSVRNSCHLKLIIVSQ
jgi:hypothetical protein